LITDQAEHMQEILLFSHGQAGVYVNTSPLIYTRNSGRFSYVFAIHWHHRLALVGLARVIEQAAR
jgi:hypothetical protein